MASLASQAAISLAHNKGDILKAAEKLANSGTLKNMATDVAFAVLIGTPSSGSSVGTHVMHQVRSSFIRMGVEGAIHGKTDRKAWLKKAVINGFASYGASQVGALHRTAVIDQATHKIAHAFIGGMTGKLMYGNKAIVPGVIGAFVSESVTELMMPTYGIDKLPAKDKPNYTQEQKLLVHAIAKSSAVLIAAICGLDTEAQIAFAVQTATTSLMFNHGQSVDEARKKGEKDEEEELAKIDLLQHLEETTGNFAAICDDEGRPITPRRLAALKAVAKFEIDYAKADEHQRTLWRQTGRTSEEVANSAYRGEQMQLGESFVAKGALGKTLTPYEQQVKNDFLIDRSIDGVAPLVFAKLGSAFSRIKEAFKGKPIQVKSASSILEKGSSLKPKMPANASNPLPSAANSNRISVAHTLTEASDAHGMQHLAQKMSGGSRSTAAADINYRQIYMSSRDSTRIGSGIGSSKSATQTALDSIAGKSAGGSLTLDGSGRTFHKFGKLTLSGSRDSGKLHVFRQNEEGRVILSVGEKVSAEDLLQRPLSLKETTARTLEKWDQVKAARATLTREQPWTIHHEGQTWKTKIIGEAQWTGTRAEQTMRTNAHAEKCYRTAVELAQDPNVEKVFLNRGIKKASGHPIQGSNRRPDVTYVTKDGKVHQVEIASKSDIPELLEARMKQSRLSLPEHMRGDHYTIKYSDYVK